MEQPKNNYIIEEQQGINVDGSLESFLTITPNSNTVKDTLLLSDILKELQQSGKRCDDVVIHAQWHNFILDVPFKGQDLNWIKGITINASDIELDGRIGGTVELLRLNGSSITCSPEALKKDHLGLLYFNAPKIEIKTGAASELECHVGYIMGCSIIISDNAFKDSMFKDKLEILAPKRGSLYRSPDTVVFGKEAFTGTEAGKVSIATDELELGESAFSSSKIRECKLSVRNTTLSKEALGNSRIGSCNIKTGKLHSDSVFMPRTRIDNFGLLASRSTTGNRAAPLGIDKTFFDGTSIGKAKLNGIVGKIIGTKEFESTNHKPVDTSKIASKSLRFDKNPTL